MAYWWVSQNKTVDEEHSGGYLWAPIANCPGSDPTSLAEYDRRSTRRRDLLIRGPGIISVGVALAAPTFACTT